MNIKILSFITYFQTVLSLLVASLCWFHFTLRKKSIKLLGFAFFIGFVSNTASLMMFHAGFGKYVNIPQSLYGVVNFILIALFYNSILQSRYTKFFSSVVFLFTAFAFYNFSFWQGTSSLNSYTDALGSVFVLAFSVLYFYRLMIELPASHLHQLPAFWFNSAFLVYRSGSMILFVFTSYLVNVMKDNMLAYWCFHNVLSVAEHCLILVGLRYDVIKR